MIISVRFLCEMTGCITTGTTNSVERKTDDDCLWWQLQFIQSYFNISFNVITLYQMLVEHCFHPPKRTIDIDETTKLIDWFIHTKWFDRKRRDIAIYSTAGLKAEKRQERKYRKGTLILLLQDLHLQIKPILGVSLLPIPFHSWDRKKRDPEKEVAFKCEHKTW